MIAAPVRDIRLEHDRYRRPMPGEGDVSSSMGRGFEVISALAEVTR